MRLTLLFLLLIPWAKPGWAQAPVAGRVVDAHTREPIPYAAIELRTGATGALTDENGYFQLHGLTPNKRDSLAVMALGYKRLAVVPTMATSQELLIGLRKKGDLPADLLDWRMQAKEISIGARAKTPGEGMIQGVTGTQYAFFCQLKSRKQLGIIRSVSFYISDHGQPREPFRVRLYAADGVANAPGTDLLNESVVVAASGGNQWYTVDLATYNVAAPGAGFFIAMEWIVDARKCNTIGDYAPCGQVLRPTFEFRENLTWSYLLGQGWTLVKLHNKGACVNAMMKAQVERE